MGTLINLSIYAGAVVCYALIPLMALTRFKDGPWYIPTGLGVALVANFLWMVLVRRQPDQESIVVSGMVWDVIVLSCLMLTPIALKVSVAPHKWVGLGIAAVGILITLWEKQ